MEIEQPLVGKNKQFPFLILFTFPLFKDDKIMGEFVLAIFQLFKCIHPIKRNRCLLFEGSVLQS